MSGCELLGPDVDGKLPLESLPPIEKESKDDVVFEELSNRKIESKVSDSGNEIYPGTGAFISKRALKPVTANQLQDGKITLNFGDTDIEAVIKVILGEQLGQNYVISPKVKGSVSFQTTKPLTKAELLPTLEILLRMNDAALLKKNSVYHIEPLSEAAALSPVSIGANLRNLPKSYQVRIVPLRYVGVDDMTEVVKPLLSEKSVLQVDKRRNLMLLAGTGQELEQAVEVINAFDVDVMNGMSFGLFPLKHVEAEIMIEDLENILDNKEEKRLTQMLRFVPIERLNAVMAITPQLRYLGKVETWIARLDRNNESSHGGVTVYRVQHVDAVELAETLSSLVSVDLPASDRSSSEASISPVETAAEISSGEPATAVPPVARTSAQSGTVNIEALADVKIVADVTNNSLIIVAKPQQYDMLMRVIRQLDIMPLQVLVDATIVSVTLTDELRHGIRWYLTHNNGGTNAASSGTGIGLTDLATAAAAAINPGFGYAFISNSDDIRAVLNAEDKDDKINVISAPSLMVLNNQEATIQVGEQIPILETTLTTEVGAVSNSIQMRETGVTLNVKPRVNANGLVIMEIEQSVDNAIPAGDSSTSSIDSPTILQRKINSTVAVHDGDTIVLGGLISNNRSYNKTGIPLLHQIPLIGALFGSTVKSLNKTELVVLITPRVVKNREDARMIATEFKRKLSGIYDDLPEQVE